MMALRKLSVLNKLMPAFQIRSEPMPPHQR